MSRKPDTPCSIWDTLLWRGRGSRATAPICRPCRHARALRTCAGCGGGFTAVYLDQRFCSRPCWHESVRLADTVDRERARLQQKNRRRRAMLRGVASDPYTMEEIAERDGHACGLCCRAVDMQLRWPHPDSPSIDHVLPLVHGGNDTRANVQLAHFGCNSGKCARTQAG